MLPDPRLLFLISIEAVDARHEQPGAAARPQTRIDVVETSRARLDREEMNQPLDEPREEALVFQRRLAIRLLLRAARVVQEHEVEIGAVAELEAAELAVADYREADCARRRPGERRAVLVCELAPRHSERMLEHELRGVGEPVADLHQRQRAESV